MLPTDAQHRHKLALADMAVSMHVMAYLPVLRRWGPKQLQALASGCAQVIATYSDGFMYPNENGGQPRVWIWPAGVFVDPGKPPAEQQPKRYIPGDEPGKFILVDAPDARPLWDRPVTVGQAIALGLCCAYLLAPDNAQPDAYGAAQLFPKATVMFRWMQQMHKAEEARP